MFKLLCVINYSAFYRCVAISDYKLIREAMSLHAFTGRPNLQPFLDRSEGTRRGNELRIHLIRDFK